MDGQHTVACGMEPAIFLTESQRGDHCTTMRPVVVVVVVIFYFFIVPAIILNFVVLSLLLLLPNQFGSWRRFRR